MNGATTNPADYRGERPEIPARGSAVVNLVNDRRPVENGCLDGAEGSSHVPGVGGPSNDGQRTADYRGASFEFSPRKTPLWGIVRPRTTLFRPRRGAVGACERPFLAPSPPSYRFTPYGQRRRPEQAAPGGH